MSAVVEVVAVAAMFLTIGDNTEAAMRKQLGIEAQEFSAVRCEPIKPTAVQYPCAADATQCLTVAASGQLCVVSDQIVLGFGRHRGGTDYELWEPEWVPSDQPTPHRLHGLWMKLQL